MSGLNHRQLFLTVLEAEKPKIKVLTESGPSERFSFWLVDISFSIDPYMTEREGGRERKTVLIFLPLFVRHNSNHLGHFHDLF